MCLFSRLYNSPLKQNLSPDPSPFGGERNTETLTVGWQASALRGEEAGHFCEVAGVSIVAVGGPVFAVHILTVDSRVA